MGTERQAKPTRWGLGEKAYLTKRPPFLSKQGGSKAQMSQKQALETQRSYFTISSEQTVDMHKSRAMVDFSFRGVPWACKGLSIRNIELDICIQKRAEPGTVEGPQTSLMVPACVCTAQLLQGPQSRSVGP